MRRIVVVTGTRAEYGILRSVIKEINKQDELQLVVTGSHLSSEFGNTVDEIIKDGYKIEAQVNINPDNDSLCSMAKSIGICTQVMAITFERLKPDIIVLLGDRIEVLASAISGSYMNIPIAHIHGGDRSISDDSARHAITKLAHIHFPATQQSANRILKLGEDEWRIYTVGSPAIDEIKEYSLKTDVIKKYRVDISKPLILFVQHSVTSEIDDIRKQIGESLESLKNFNYPVIAIYPNSDAGNKTIIDGLMDCISDNIKVFKSIPRQDYLGLLQISNVLVGNSSSGIIETPYLGIPSVNIGNRQQGRERDCNVLNVGYDRNEITSAIKYAIFDFKFKCRHIYGSGGSGLKIASTLHNIELSKRLLQKTITY
ncbi:UDP-N-acetylglucosamine 2-epimerase [Candidatus Dojkabacteria bacterium]|jgi:UDP-N-acetylglucosamine 2-epimerase (non-hydrolysing)/GDP/UDP-N,N'-diacetylbacillosamine 2-epimerase (hydrolysing)|nr:UDP-N-acetylglucosamine 2-epimerase [Candidatus Dojkabacteria bacterium]